MAWDLRRLQLHAQKSEPLPVYLLVGEDTFLRGEALKVIKSMALSEGAVDFNFDQFYAGDDEAGKIRDAIEMLPMMSPRRLVVVKEAQAFKERDWQSLLPVLLEPVGTTTLVLLSDKIDRRKKEYKAVESSGAVVELPRPYENQLVPWLEYIASQHGLRLSKEASSLLRQLVGVNLTELNSERAKLKEFLGAQVDVTPEAVLQVVSRTRSDSVFDLTNALGRKDRAAALSSLANLLGQGQSEIGALAMMARHLRILAAVREGQKQGRSPTQLAADAGVPQFFLKDYLSQAGQWSEDKLERAVHALKETDLALKSSPVSAPIWLENFILKTCN